MHVQVNGIVTVARHLSLREEYAAFQLHIPARHRQKVPTVSSRPDLRSSGSSHSFVARRFSFVCSGSRRLFGLFRGFKRLLQFHPLDHPLH
jgi:hypothetical protein